MVELDDAMRRALLAREGPPTGARDEILASLRTRLGGPSDPGSDSGDSGESGPGDLGGPSELASSQLTWAAKVVAATLGLTASGLLTLKLGALAITAITPDEPPREAPIEIVEPRAIVESREPLEVASPAPAEVDAAPARDPAVGSGQPAASSKSGTGTGESTLAAELVLVRAAKRASADDPEAALDLLDRHREQFPDGMLAPEREALRIEMLCELGRLPASCSKVGMDSSAAGD